MSTYYPPSEKPWRKWEWLLLPLAIPVFLILTYYSVRRHPEIWFERSVAYIWKTFTSFMMIWIAFGLFTWAFDHQHAHDWKKSNTPEMRSRELRVFPGTDPAIATDPELYSFGPLAWSLVHGQWLTSGLASNVTQTLGMKAVHRFVADTYTNSVGMYSERDKLTIDYVWVGVIAYITLLLLPLVLLIVLYQALLSLF